MLTFSTAAWLIAVGAGLGLILTRLTRSVAARVGLVDSPDRHRKTQLAPVPVAGGVAVLVAALAALAVGALVDPNVAAALTADPQKSLSLLASALLIAAVGLTDDRYNLRARHKLLGQTLAVLVLVLAGDFIIHRV